MPCPRIGTVAAGMAVGRSVRRTSGRRPQALDAWPHQAQPARLQVSAHGMLIGGGQEPRRPAPDNPRRITPGQSRSMRVGGRSQARHVQAMASAYLQELHPGFGLVVMCGREPRCKQAPNRDLSRKRLQRADLMARSGGWVGSRSAPIGTPHLRRFPACDQCSRPDFSGVLVQHLFAAERQDRPDWVALTSYDLCRGRAAVRR